MSAYFILTHTITDIEKFRQEYIPKVFPFLQKYGAQVIVADSEAEPLEGDPAKAAVVIRFPSEQAIRDFVNDPDYQPVKAIRLALTTNANAVSDGKTIVAGGQDSVLRVWKDNGQSVVNFEAPKPEEAVAKAGG